MGDNSGPGSLILKLSLFPFIIVMLAVDHDACFLIQKGFTEKAVAIPVHDVIAEVRILFTWVIEIQRSHVLKLIIFLKLIN